MIQSLGKDGTKSVSFTVAKPDMLRTIDVLNDNKDSLGIKKLDYDENVAKISVIGAGVRSHSGVAAKMFGALANAGINTEMITTRNPHHCPDRRSIRRSGNACDP